MFVDFNKVFSKTPQTNLKIPKELAEQLSTNLPDGFHYVIDKNTNNIVISTVDEQDVVVNGIIICPTDAQLETLGSNYEFGDLMKLCYNSQTPIPVKLKDGKFVSINGQDVSVDRLAYNPFKPYSIIPDSTRIVPPHFPSAFSIPVGCEKGTIYLTINRVPNNSVDVATFESESNHCFSIKYSINSKTDFFSITMNVNPKYAKTVKEILDAYNIYNAFVEGKGTIAGISIDAKLQVSETSKFDEDAIHFWERVYELETKLGVAFLPPFAEMDFDDICNIEEVYQNIIKNTPVRKNRCINTITSKWDFSKDSAVEETIGKPVCFEYEGTSTIELFGITIELPFDAYIFNAKLSDYKKDDNTGECTLFLESESEEKRMFESILRFLTNEDLTDYKTKVQNRMQLFHEAKKRYEFLM